MTTNNELRNIDSNEKTTIHPKKIEILEDIVIIPNAIKIKCQYCEKSYAKHLFAEHQKIHESDFFNCQYPNCEKKFQRRSSLRKHKYFHEKKFKYKCIECDSKFIDLNKFEIHKNIKHHSGSSQLYKCQICEKDFKSKEYFKKHQVTHNDEQKYSCKFCGQKFKWLTSLRTHHSIHNRSSLETFRCTKCQKKFVNQKTLDRHVKIHEERTFICSICGSVASKRKDNIRRHIKHIHSEINSINLSEYIFEEKAREESRENEKDTIRTFVSNDNVRENYDDQNINTATPVMNNRVNVIQSIGNPNRRRHIEPISVLETVALSSAEKKMKMEEENTSLFPNQSKIESILPPKKNLTTSSVQNPDTKTKTKYDPIEHYRLILLGSSRDDSENKDVEDHVDYSGEHENQSFIHWRKRASNFFLQRN